jgi:hypothetical protein
MANNKMVELQRRWKAFTSDRARAKRDIQTQDDQDNAEIARLREGIIRRNAEFDEKWRSEKSDLQHARDEAVMQAMSGLDGRSAQYILRELGSNNTVWIYELRGRLQAQGVLPEQLKNANSRLTASSISVDDSRLRAALVFDSKAQTSKGGHPVDHMDRRTDRPYAHKSGKKLFYPDEVKYGQGERVRVLEPYTVAEKGDVGTITSVPVSTTPIYYVTVDRSGETGIIPERLLEPE